MRLQDVFRWIIDNRGHTTPPDWDPTRYGVGIVDAEALLATPLPDVAVIGGGFGAFAAPNGDPVGRIAALLSDADPDLVAAGLASALSVDQTALRDVLPRYEGEIAYLVLQDAEFRHRILSGGGPGALPPAPPPAASGELGARLG